MIQITTCRQLPTLYSFRPLSIQELHGPYHFVTWVNHCFYISLNIFAHKPQHYERFKDITGKLIIHCRLRGRHLVVPHHPATIFLHLKRAAGLFFALCSSKNGRSDTATQCGQRTGRYPVIAASMTSAAGLAKAGSAFTNSHPCG